MNGKMKSLRSPLSQARGLGSAKSGTVHWISLRMTALALIPLSLYVLIGFIVCASSGSYSDAITWLRAPLSSTVMILFVLAGAFHGASGMREVIEDYVHHQGAKILSVFLSNFAAAAVAAVGTLSVIKIFIGN